MKIKTMIITHNKKHRKFPALVINGTTLDEVQSHKHLGVRITKDLNCDEYVEDLVCVFQLLKQISVWMFSRHYSTFHLHDQGWNMYSVGQLLQATV